VTKNQFTEFMTAKVHAVRGSSERSRRESNAERVTLVSTEE